MARSELGARLWQGTPTGTPNETSNESGLEDLLRGADQLDKVVMGNAHLGQITDCRDLVLLPFVRPLVLSPFCCDQFDPMNAGCCDDQKVVLIYAL